MSSFNQFIFMLYYHNLMSLPKSTIPFRTMLKEINETNNDTVDINEVFQVRKQIYDNKDLFYKIAENEQIIIENKEEINEITENVKKGRQLLLDELSKNRQLLNDKIYLEEFESISLDICNESLQKINNLKLCFDNQELDTNELQNHIDNIEYSIRNILELIKDNFKIKTQNIDSKFDKNNAIIKTLSDLYNIFKSTSSLHTCPACMSSESDVFCNCGHTFCRNCIEKSKYCYICRAPIGKINKLFFN